MLLKGLSAKLAARSEKTSYDCKSAVWEMYAALDELQAAVAPSYPAKHNPKPSFIEAAILLESSRTTYQDSCPAFTSTQKTAQCTLARPE